ncbi:MAG: ECF-type sigma factor [Nannocystaceae bacterium]
MAVEDEGVTGLLRAWSQGDRSSLDRVTPRIYGELRRIAAAQMRRERDDHTLSPTEVIHEAFVRLAGAEQPSIQDRIHFLAIAARQMRHILVDHARRRAADKRGGPARPIPFEEASFVTDRPEALCALDDAIAALAEVDERKARVVELRHFGGMTQQEIAEVLGVHVNTVARDLRMAEAWLHRELRPGGAR